MKAALDDVRFIERLALFSSAMTGNDVSSLLLGLSTEHQAAATAFLRQLSELDSGARQARLTLEFGWRSDALTRLQAVVVEAPPGLRLAVGEAMPPLYAAHFPHLKRGAPTSPALRGLATRLVRDALRE